jgi:diguanylate cyclase (GGDEF)-like protein
MPKLTPVLSIIESDHSLMKKLDAVKRASLLIAASIALVVLAAWLMPPIARLLPAGWEVMTAQTALMTLFSAVSLWLSESRRSRRAHLVSLSLAGITALVTSVILVEYAFQVSLSTREVPWLPPGRMSPQTAAGLVFLAFCTLFLRARRRLLSCLADLLLFCLCLLDLILISGYAFDAAPMFGLSTTVRTSPHTLICLVLLTLAAFLRRSEKSFFSIFFGSGIGSKTARGLAPILLLMPFLREMGRTRMLQAHLIPEQYASAILASAATALSFALLLILAWRIDSMEKEIRDLSLRDELTGLYNLRGFHILAEQSLRLAQRSRAPFSVLFIDLDNLKQINDLHGHSVGSSTLAETGELLQATFRESDVLARIGGDEFAVAGQFSHAAIIAATQRLRDASAHRNAHAGPRAPLSFSIGHVTSEQARNEPLKTLLSKADEAMYQEKRSKKNLVHS